MTEDQYTDDSADVSQLEQRIDELEETIRQMLPSRREAIGMGVAGLAGASLMSGTASAGSAQVGTIGDASNLVDLVAEDVTITDTLNTASLASAPAGDALLSDGNGNLQFGAAGGVEEVSTFADLPPVDPPQLAYINNQNEYYRSFPTTGTAFDLSNATLQNSINTQGSNVTGLAFNNNGSKMFECDENGNIYESNLSAPFDISTASFSTTISSQDSRTEGIAFNNDGSKLYEVGSGSQKIYQYDLSSNFDLSSASFQTSINTTGPSPQSITWNDDGSKMYVADRSTGDIVESTLSTAFDITTASVSNTVSASDSTVTGIFWSPDGLNLIETLDAPEQISHSVASVAFDLNTLSSSSSLSAQSNSPQGCRYNNTGARVYEINAGDNKIHEYKLFEGGWEAF